jgi:broad specificity phosphatase PhoE
MSEPSTDYEFTFLRHGESEGNLLNILQGQSDYPLTPEGEQQARSLGHTWAAQGVRFDRAICSTQLRARQTAELVTAYLPTPLEFDPLWMERSFGQFEGLTVDQVEKENPGIDFLHPYHVMGATGESHLDLYRRACQAVQKLLTLPPCRCLVVSHGSMLNATLYAIMGLAPQGRYNSPRFRFANTGFCVFTYHPPRLQWRMTALDNQVRLPLPPAEAALAAEMMDC